MIDISFVNPKRPLVRNGTLALAPAKPSKRKMYDIRTHNARTSRLLDCYESIKNADRVRRSNFFRSKARGGSSTPPKNRQHKRTC